MGSSTKKKTTRQPTQLLMAGASPPGVGKIRTALELFVPLVNIRQEIFAGIKVGESIRVVDAVSRIDVMVKKLVLGEVAPHFELPVRKFPSKRGVIDAIDRVSSTVVVRLSF
jgi:hypothetical protein